MATVDVAGAALRSRWGRDIAATTAAELAGSGRSAVLRIALTGADAPATTAIVKAYDGGSRWQNEAACAAYLGRIGGGLTPGLLALDVAHRVIVLSDLGDHPQLSDVLLGEDATAARRALVRWAESLGTLLARTFGGRAELDQTFATLGFQRPLGFWDPRLRGTCRRLRAVVRERLGINAPSGLEAELASALRILDDRETEVVSPADACPDNNLLAPDAVRFIDLEFGGCTSVFLEAAYTRLPFPTCWCLLDSPTGVLDAAEQAMRGPLVAAKSELGDDEVWRAGMARACALWVISNTVFVLEQPTSAFPSKPWVRDSVPIPGADRVVLHYLAKVDTLFGSELPACAELLTEIRRRLIAEWGKLDLGVYPAFSTKGT